MKRTYVQAERARAARANGERILAAAEARFAGAYYDEVTLDQIATDAGVTVQTVIRRFGSKEDIVRAITETVGADIVAQREQAPAGDLPATVANLVEHYETQGDHVMHLLRQELRVPAFAEVTAKGKQVHADWCARVFAPYLDFRAGLDRRRLLAQLIATCDVYTWHLLRRQRGLSKRQTERALLELLEGVLS